MNIRAIIAGLAIIGIVSLFWLNIFYGTGQVSEAETASLSFANSVMVGWADDIAVNALYHNDYYAKQSAVELVQQTVNYGHYEYPDTTAIAAFIGGFFSIGGVVAVMLARSAQSAMGAFKLGFFAEIAEGLLYQLGWYATMGSFSVSNMEIILTLVTGLIMGVIAIAVHSQHKKRILGSTLRDALKA